MKNPIEKIEWVEVEELNANNYNPNFVQNQEFKLLEYSLLKTGWIQPILVHKETMTIIDGFHRCTLVRTSKKVREKLGSKVPVCFFDLSLEEMKFLTIRINRAKGNHTSLKMSDIVISLVESGISVEEIMENIGATREEVELLLTRDVFKAKNIENHKYSQAWVPKPKIKRK